MPASTDQMPRCWTVCPADGAGTAEAARRLAAGEAVVLPTETVYGLAADAARPEAVAQVFRLKGRPPANPLIVHVSGPPMARALGLFGPVAEALAGRFWPGPLTLVLPRAPGARLVPAVTAGLATVALRQSAHPVMAAVLARLGRPLAAPSANVSGRLSPTRARHVALPGGGLVLDGGAAAVGVESTIVRLEPGGAARLLRPGGLPAAEIEAALGRPLLAPAPGRPQAPGMAFRHYAPRLPLILDCVAPPPNSFHLGFGPVAGDENLSPAGDVSEAAARLFDALHRADATDAERIAVAPIPAAGAGAAMRDRLARGASAQAAGAGRAGRSPGGSARP